MRRTIAIATARAARLISRLLGNSATALPGLVAEKIDPNILEKLAKNNFKQGIIVVTGTNGKTTTSKIICDSLRLNKINVLNNKAGSNLYRGIVTTIISKSNMFGKCSYDLAVFEVDEAYVEKVCLAIKPNKVVVTNLFRDQLDRYGELNSIKNRFEKTFKQLKNTGLILNADDPLVASLGLNSNRQVEYFGISQYGGPKITNDHSADSIFDPITNEKLSYSQRYFGHIGIYKSLNGELSRPKPNVEVVSISKIDCNTSGFTVKIDKKSKLEVKSNLPGLYNIYNFISAVSVLKSFLSNADIQSSLNMIQSAFGRGEKLTYKNTSLKLLLIKNPTGFNQVIQTFLKGKQQNIPIMICINDKIADGTDVSWLWDVAIEDVSNYKGKIIVSGSRAYDMALRLKYANITNFEIEPDYKQALGKLCNIAKKDQMTYILATYTAMLSIRSIITSSKKMVQSSEVNK